MIVVEIEVDDLSIAVDCNAGNVVSDIPIPVDAKLVRIGDHVAAVALRRLGGLHLLHAPRIGTKRTSFVAVPEPDDQLHEQMAVDLMSLLDRLVRQFGCGCGEVDGDDVTQLHRPKFSKWFLLVESWRRRSLGLSGRQRRAAAERAGSTGGGNNEVASVDVVAIAHRNLHHCQNLVRLPQRSRTRTCSPDLKKYPT